MISLSEVDTLYECAFMIYWIAVTTTKKICVKRSTYFNIFCFCIIYALILHFIKYKKGKDISLEILVILMYVNPKI